MSDKNVVIVTGGNYGIGRSITRVLAEKGHQVVAFGLDSKQIGSEAANGTDGTRELLDSLGLDADLLEADVSKPEDVQRVTDFTMEKHGQINGLVNNAAIHPSGRLLDTPEDVWDKVMEVNLKGPYLMTKAVLPQMISQGGGAIVNTGSGSQWGRGNLQAYCASKGGLYAFSQALAYDYIHEHIRVNMVIPGGGPLTGMTEGPRDFTQAGGQVRPGGGGGSLGTVTGRRTETEEVAYAIAFLLSDESAQISGTIIDVGCFEHQGGPVRPRQTAEAPAAAGQGAR